MTLIVTFKFRTGSVAEFPTPPPVAYERAGYASFKPMGARSGSVGTIGLALGGSASGPAEPKRVVVRLGSGQCLATINVGPQLSWEQLDAMIEETIGKSLQLTKSSSAECIAYYEVGAEKLKRFINQQLRPEMLAFGYLVEDATIKIELNW